MAGAVGARSARKSGDRANRSMADLRSMDRRKAGREARIRTAPEDDGAVPARGGTSAQGRRMPCLEAGGEATRVGYPDSSDRPAPRPSQDIRPSDPLRRL